jgi:hypothetical protein
MSNNFVRPTYPTVLTVVLGFPVTVIGIIIFAIVGDADGQFDPIETIVFATMIVNLVIFGIVDLVRWDNWKKRNRR